MNKTKKKATSTSARLSRADFEAELGKYITVRQAARLTTMSVVSIRRFLSQGKLRRFKVGARTLLLLADVENLIREA